MSNEIELSYLLSRYPAHAMGRCRVTWTTEQGFNVRVAMYGQLGEVRVSSGDIADDDKDRLGPAEYPAELLLTGVDTHYMCMAAMRHMREFIGGNIDVMAAALRHLIRCNYSCEYTIRRADEAIDHCLGL